MLTTLVDIDLDLDLDLVRGGDWFENYDGAGNFTRHVLLSDDAVAQVADFDADGLADILTTNGNLLRNFGNGQFESAAHIGHDSAFASYSVLDLGGDGDLDIAAVTADRSEAHLWVSNGPGFQFQAGGIVPLPVGFRSLADVDLDGDLDLAVIERHDDFLEALADDLTPRDVYMESLWYYQNDGTNNFALQRIDGSFIPHSDWQGAVARDPNTQEIVYIDEWFPSIVTERFVLADGYLADVNGDGKVDFVSAHFFSNIGPVTWFENLDGSMFGDAQQLGDAGHGDVTLSDFDQDGDLDVLNTDYMTDAAFLRINLGHAFVDHATFALHQTPGRPESAGDLNADGKLDLLLTSSTNGIPDWVDGASFTLHQNVAQPMRPSELIAQLQAAVRAGNSSTSFDYNRDGLVDASDVEYLVRLKIRSTFGDADLNNRFDSSDLVRVFAAGEYEDGVIGNSSWETGDWNGDGEFDSSDLVYALQFGGYEADSDRVLAYDDAGEQYVASLADLSVRDDFLPTLAAENFGQQNNMFPSQNMAISPDGHLARFARRTDSLFPGGDLFVFDENGSLRSQTPFAEFGSVAFGPDGTLYVLHQHSIQRFAVTEDGQLMEFGSYPASNQNLWNPEIAFGPDGFIYLANHYAPTTGERRVTRYDAQTGRQDTDFMVPLWLNKMAFATSTGILYTETERVDPSTGTVSQVPPFNPNGTSSFTFGREDEILVLSVGYDEVSGRFSSVVDRYSLSTTEHLGTVMTVNGSQDGLEYWPGR